MFIEFVLKALFFCTLGYIVMVALMAIFLLYLKLVAPRQFLDDKVKNVTDVRFNGNDCVSAVLWFIAIPMLASPKFRQKVQSFFEKNGY